MALGILVLGTNVMHQSSVTLQGIWSWLNWQVVPAVCEMKNSSSMNSNLARFHHFEVTTLLKVSKVKLLRIAVVGFELCVSYISYSEEFSILQLSPTETSLHVS